MAKKITRLGDPANPFGKKKTPSSQAVKPSPRASSTPAKKAPTVTAPKGKGLIKDLNDKFGGGARKRAIDAAIEGRKP